MCDYSLHHVASRPAKVSDKLVTTELARSSTRGFAAVGEHGAKLVIHDRPPQVAVCPITTFAQEPNGGLIIMPTAINTVVRERILALAARHRLPAVYPFRHFATSGGLMSYGPDLADLFRRSGSYVDRILQGAKPSDLPVQHPTKFEFVANLKTAQALGLEIPPTLLARADEVIE
jgi:ABC-type uncharacterized transport system substrate-binding protein